MQLDTSRRSLMQTPEIRKHNLPVEDIGAHSDAVRTAKVGLNQGTYMLIRATKTRLELLQYTGVSALTQQEEMAKGEDWGILKSGLVFFVFFSIFLFFVTRKNTEAARQKKQAQYKQSTRSYSEPWSHGRSNKRSPY